MSRDQNDLAFMPRKLPRSYVGLEMKIDSPPMNEPAERMIPELSGILENDKNNYQHQPVNPYFNETQNCFQRSNQAETLKPAYVEPENCVKLTKPAVSYHGADRPLSNVQTSDKGETLRHPVEPYNTWKTKNAQVLDSITSSLREVGTAKTGYNTSDVFMNSAGRKQVTTALVPDKQSNYNPYHNQHTPPPFYDGDCAGDFGYSPNQNENMAPWYHPVTGQYNIQHPPGHVYHQQYSHSVKKNGGILFHHERDLNKFSQKSEGRLHDFPFHSVPQNYQRRQILPTETYSGVMRKTCHSNFDNNCGDCTETCGCRPPKVLEPVQREPPNKPIHCSEAKKNAISSSEIAQINKDTTGIMDLYNIIRLQNEQILMLQQQVNQLLQLHLECTKSTKENQYCECSRKKFDPDVRNKISTQTLDVKSYVNENTSVHKIVPCLQVTKTYECNKQSVGVMTSCIDASADMPISNVTKMVTNPKRQELERKSKCHQEDLHSHREQQQDGKLIPLNQEEPCACNACFSQKSSSTKQKRAMAEEKRNQHYTSTPAEQDAIKTTKAHKRYGDQLDKSSSLNEAEIVVANEPEVDDSDLVNSVHIDLEQYYSTSDSSSSDASSSGEESDQEQSSDSWPGQPAYPRHKPEDTRPAWTFYDQQRIRNPTRKENLLHQDKPKRSHGHHAYNGNRPYDAENWSKRVTFDGPFVEESGNNMSDSTGFQHRRDQRDVRRGGPNRMQDMRMYNMANGNTNLSFATLRYFERYQLIPPQVGPDVTDVSVHNSHKGRRQNKKKKKSSVNMEKYPCNTKKNHTKETSVITSRILDITALREKPKLF